MKIIKIIGLFSLISFAFFCTDKMIDVSIEQDKLMIDIKDNMQSLNVNSIDAKLDGDYIIPGKIGKEVNIKASYSKMKKNGYYDSEYIIYDEVYPNISIFNNYDKYIIKGNVYSKKVSLIYIINNYSNLDNIYSLINDGIKLSFFIDSNYLNNHIDIIDKIKSNEIYNYGDNGVYTKDTIIIANNIINNKAKNKSMYCLFLDKDNDSLNNCANSKMLSIMASIRGDITNIKNKLENGSIILINNSMEVKIINDYINSKGYEIVPLSKLIYE